jgi:DNA polymerase III delta prime subunit
MYKYKKYLDVFKLNILIDKIKVFELYFITDIMNMLSISNSKPWVEKYRPALLNDIVLDNLNYSLLSNMLEYNIFPNLLLYGPPGTGKTTTIMTLVNQYQQNNNQSNKGLMIHLNASDERGIDIIRNQICQFVNSYSLFSSGLKIVILDEVDYMTKNAQQALKQLIHLYHKNVRFCLICNYITRIDETLKNEFIHLRFNQLPPERIFGFLNGINEKEQLHLSKDILCSIQSMFQSDIRSMINYIQSNHTMLSKQNVMTENTWILLTKSIKKSIPQGIKQIYILMETYNVDLKHVIREYTKYILFQLEKQNETTQELNGNSNSNSNELYSYLKLIEELLHTNDYVEEDIIHLFIKKTNSFIKYVL